MFTNECRNLIQPKPIKMSSKDRDIKKFQVNFLQFLSEKKVADVHIYHHVMNYWSNDSSMISLQSLKEAITDLCDKKFIVSKNNGHLLLGSQGISEENQKNNAICSIEKTGIAYLKKNESIKKTKTFIALLVIVGIIFSLWHFRKIIIDSLK